MADTKLSALAELAATPAADDELYIRDVSEEAASESKRITVSNLLSITREVFLPANEGRIEAGATSNLGQCATVIGTADANEPYICFGMKVPIDFVSFTKVEAVWSTYATSGNMYWKILATYAANGEDMSTTHTDYPDLGATASSGRYVLVVQEPANPLTLVNLALGDYLGLRFTRQGTDALDTLNTTAYLIGLLFTYVANR